MSARRGDISISCVLTACSPAALRDAHQCCPVANRTFIRGSQNRRPLGGSHAPFLGLQFLDLSAHILAPAGVRRPERTGRSHNISHSHHPQPAPRFLHSRTKLYPVSGPRARPADRANPICLKLRKTFLGGSRGLHELLRQGSPARAPWHRGVRVQDRHDALTRLPEHMVCLARHAKGANITMAASSGPRCSKQPGVGVRLPHAWKPVAGFRYRAQSVNHRSSSLPSSVRMTLMWVGSVCRTNRSAGEDMSEA